MINELRGELESDIPIENKYPKQVWILLGMFS